MGAVIPAYKGTQDAFTKTMPDADLQVFLDAVDYAKPAAGVEEHGRVEHPRDQPAADAFDGSKPGRPRSRRTSPRR